MLAAIAVIVILVGGGFFFFRGGDSSSSTSDMNSVMEDGKDGDAMMEDKDGAMMDGEDHDAMMEKSYTLAEIAEHSEADDCWFAIEGKVYDVTDYIADQRHPGGAAILEGCGLDATELFNTRPMGSGTPHSEKARSFLPNFEIGTLAE